MSYFGGYFIMLVFIERSVYLPFYECVRGVCKEFMFYLFFSLNFIDLGLFVLVKVFSKSLLIAID
jgi:hypothetical protein